FSLREKPTAFCLRCNIELTDYRHTRFTKMRYHIAAHDLRGLAQSCVRSATASLNRLRFPQLYPLSGHSLLANMFREDPMRLKILRIKRTLCLLPVLLALTIPAFTAYAGAQQSGALFVPPAGLSNIKHVVFIVR